MKANLEEINKIEATDIQMDYKYIVISSLGVVTTNYVKIIQKMYDRNRKSATKLYIIIVMVEYLKFILTQTKRAEK
jgi:hypothetical protein